MSAYEEVKKQLVEAADMDATGFDPTDYAAGASQEFLDIVASLEVAHGRMFELSERMGAARASTMDSDVAAGTASPQLQLFTYLAFHLRENEDKLDDMIRALKEVARIVKKRVKEIQRQ